MKAQANCWRERLLWVTRQYVHLDRVASPWLVSRFVDSDASFCYVPWGEEHLAPKDAIPLAIPGAELAPHDHVECTFDKILRKYGLAKDPALSRLGGIIRAGIAHVLEDYTPAEDDEDGQIAIGLLALSEGLMLRHQDDDAILTASFPIYDALYTALKMRAHLAREGIVIPHKGEDGRGPSLTFERSRKIYNEVLVG